MKLKFLAVDLEIGTTYGWDVAALLSYLILISRNLKKDDHGYFSLDTGYIMVGIGVDRQKFIRLRNKCVDLKLLDYIEGRNQNLKPRYKILKRNF